MGKENKLGKIGFVFGLLTAIVFGILFICDLPFTLLMGIAGISMIESAADIGMTIGMISFFVIICVILGAIMVGGIVVCVLTKKYDVKLRKYLTVIAKERKLETIARALGKNYDEVKTDVKKIIEKGYLESAYLDEGTDEIVFTAEKKKSGAGKDAKPMANDLRAVVCPCCGAKNTISGAACECEFCGTILR